MKRFTLALGLFACLWSFAQTPRWDKGMPYPLEGRSNPYNLSEHEFFQVRSRGLDHALTYPVQVTGILMPYEITKEFLEGKSKNPFRKVVEDIFRSVFAVKSFDDLSRWLGLNEYPQAEGEGIYYVPFPDGRRPEYRMGLSLVDYKGVDGFTYSCATCHSGDLFGKKIIGLTNRFPRANHFFIRGKKALNSVSANTFKLATGANAAEKELFARSRQRIRSVNARQPRHLGLDTSLAHVALSLAHRNKDEYATFNKKLQQTPRHEPLRNFTADSKPAVWWNVKYKNRWLLDGSVVSGNPIITNLLWNEIGRGTDLKELEQWLDDNGEVIKELTTAVFSSQAPRYEDFFTADLIERESALRGEKVFEKRCSKCHGHYVKGWSLPEFENSPWEQQIQTVEVQYFEQTPVINVGTDLNRADGMKSLLQLNDLAISKSTGVMIEQQKGYVPPPLVGIWARWPYFHNNSVPNLCELLKVGKDRVKKYWAGPANDPQTDFDNECVGYPVGEGTPRNWKKNQDNLYSTDAPGLSNKGHDENILVRYGRELLTEVEKRDLITYLKTL